MNYTIEKYIWNQTKKNSSHIIQHTVMTTLDMYIELF